VLLIGFYLMEQLVFQQDSELFDITEKSEAKNNIQVVFRPKSELISR
jgi:hypothetical protein